MRPSGSPERRRSRPEVPVSTKGYLRGFPGLLRRLADRIDYANAPKAIGTSFTFECGEGIRFRDDRRGCPLWYLGDDDYQRAHDEADKPC